MNRLQVRTLSPAIAFLSGLVMGCGGDGTDPPVPATVDVTPGTVDLASIGATQLLTATVLDEAGAAINVSVTWSSSSSTVASVSTAGLVTARANGGAIITATAGSIPGTSSVTVEQVLAGVALAPSSFSLMAGFTDRILARAEDANSNEVAGASLLWSSNNLAVATVDQATGAITGVAAGTAIITAAATGGTPSSPVTVDVIPAAASTLTAIKPVLNGTCGTAGCHSGGSPEAGMDLSSGNVFSNTVGVASSSLSSMNRVTPNEPLQSYLIHKLRGTQTIVGGGGSQMPLSGSITAAEIATIVAWILGGALNN